MSKPNLLPKPQMRPTTAYTPTSYNPNGTSTTSAYKPSLYTPPTTTGQPTVNTSNPSLTPSPNPNPNSPTTAPKPLPTFAPRPVLQRDPTQTVPSSTHQHSPTYQEREHQQPHQPPHQPPQHTHVQPSYTTPSMPSSHTLSFAPTNQQLPSAPQHNASSTTRPTSNSNNSYQPALQPSTTQNSQATQTSQATQGYQAQGYGASPILRPGSPTLPSLPATPTTPPQQPPNFQPNFAPQYHQQPAQYTPPQQYAPPLQNNSHQPQQYSPPSHSNPTVQQYTPTPTPTQQYTPTPIPTQPQGHQVQPVQQHNTLVNSSQPALHVPPTVQMPSAPQSATVQPQAGQVKRPSINPMLSKGILPGLKNPTLKSPSLSAMKAPTVEVVIPEEEPEIFEYLAYEWTAYSVEYLDADQLRIVPRLTTGTFPTPDIPARPRDLNISGAFPKLGEMWTLKSRAEGISLQHNYNTNPTSSSSGSLSSRLTRSLSRSGKDSATVNSIASAESRAERERPGSDGTTSPVTSDGGQESPPQQNISPTSSNNPQHPYRLSNYGAHSDSKANLRVALTTQPPTTGTGLSDSDPANSSLNPQVQRVSRAVSPRTSASSGTMSAQLAQHVANANTNLGSVNSSPLTSSTANLTSSSGQEVPDYRRSNPLNRNASSVRLGGAYQPQPGQGASTYQPTAYKPMPYQAPSQPAPETDQAQYPHDEQQHSNSAFSNTTYPGSSGAMQPVQGSGQAGFQASRPVHKKSNPRFDLSVHAQNK